MILSIQVAVISRINLLSGFADLILLTLAAWALQKHVPTAWHWAILGGLMVGFVSGLPWFIPLAGYLLIVWLGRILQRRVWQAPLLVMFLVTFLGTMFIHMFSFVVLRLLGNPLPINVTLGSVTLPSLLLNLLLATPVYVLVRDFASWMHPVNEEE